MNLDEIEARANAATPGPHEPTTWERLCKGGYQWRAVGPLRATKEQADSDAAFIAAARTDVPALVARVRELEAALKEIAVGDYSDPFCKRTPEQRAREALEGKR